MMTINTRPNGQTAEVRLIPEGLITKEELAKRLRKSIRTIETWQRRRLIPFIKVANSVLFDWDKVQQHLSERYSVVQADPASPRQ